MCISRWNPAEFSVMILTEWQESASSIQENILAFDKLCVRA